MYICDLNVCWLVHSINVVYYVTASVDTREFSLTIAHVRQRGHSEAGPREPERRRHLLRLLHAQD